MRTGHERVLELVSRSGLVLIPTTVLGELEAGFRLGSSHADNRRALEEFRSEPFVAMLTSEADRQ